MNGDELWYLSRFVLPDMKAGRTSAALTALRHLRRYDLDRLRKARVERAWIERAQLRFPFAARPRTTR